MSPGSFLRDRLGYIGAFAASGLFALAVVHLSLALRGERLGTSELVYIALAGAAILGLWLLLDYHRQKSFFEQLRGAVEADDLHASGLLDGARTVEQRLYRDAWQRLHSRLVGALAQEREKGKRRVHFISQWAHLMKTPLAVIDLELQKARREGTSPLVESLLEENERLAHLLQMLLNVSRLEEFDSDLRIEEVDLACLVRRVINEHRRAFIAHRVFPRVEEPAFGAPVVVHTDAKWLRLALEQILSNAWKYASRPERDGRVLVRLSRREKEVLLEVSDDGVGIGAEDLPRVFEPFFTGANGRRYSRSTGMGLYLAKEICDRLGHRLSLQSRPDEGTTVTLRFTGDPTLYGPFRRILAER